MAGSRPGNIIAGTWAALMKIGQTGYIENAKVILNACSELKKAIKTEVPELIVATRDNSCVVSLIQRSEAGSINPIALMDVMKANFNYKMGST